MMHFLFKKMNTCIYIRWRTFLVFFAFHNCSFLRFSSFPYHQLINKMWLSLSELSGQRHPHQLSIVVCLGDIGGGPRCLFWGPSFLVMRQQSWWQELPYSFDPLFVLNSVESTQRRRNNKQWRITIILIMTTVVLTVKVTVTTIVMMQSYTCAQCE